MAEENDTQQDDPFSSMVRFYDDWTKTWSGAMSEAVSSKGFADTMAQQLEGSLSAAGLMRRQMNELMERYLQQVNLPSRNDVAGLAEHMTRFEMRLDDLEDKVEQILELLRSQ
jgi:polyhydroxyalkanoate synthesis regulator phasin